MDGSETLGESSNPALTRAIAFCESEELRRPERIQSFGCLISVDDAGQISGTSTNVSAMTRRSARIGSTLKDFLTSDDASVQKILARAAENCQPSLVNSDLIPKGISNRFEVLTHRSTTGSIIEFIPLEPEIVSTPLPPAIDIGDVFRLCLTRAERIRALTGYDRVMIYRFHQDFTGEVIAEVRKPQLVPYLGLRYPATDIPGQARALYLENRSRLIANVHSATSKLVASPTINLSMARLRAVSPYHIEYLKNMQVVATLTLSIVVEGVLWGLVACHHGQERLLNYARQEAALAEADALSAAITTLGLKEAMAAKRAGRSQRVRWRERLGGSKIVEPLLSGTDSIISDLKADGGAIVCGDAWLGVGATPDGNWLLDAARRIDPGSDLICTDRLSELDQNGHTSASAGAMISRLEGEIPTTLFVFRRAQSREVHWGGDPRAAVIVSPTDGKPSPRQSFSLWRELVKDRARPWTSQERRVFSSCIKSLSASLARSQNATILLQHELGALAGAYSEMTEAHRLLGGALPDGVAVLIWSVEGKKSRLLYANRAFDTLFGLVNKDIVGKDISHIFERTQLNLMILDHLDFDEQEIDLWSAALGVRRVRARREPLVRYKSPSQELEVQSLFLSDMTGASRTQEALLAAVRQAEVAESARGALLRNMSHELRTPLNTIVGYSDMIAQELVGPVAVNYKHAAEAIKSAAGHLLDLINDTLEVARLKSGAARIQAERHDVGMIVLSAIKLVRELAATRGIKLAHSLPQTPVYAIVDELAIRQIIINLVNNAVKFTHQGGSVDVSLVTDDDGSASMIVADTGIGIPADHIDRLFTPFAQVDSSLDRSTGGSGLGLAIVKELIQLHGGKIELASGEGVGSAFTVRIPAWRVEANS